MILIHRKWGGAGDILVHRQIFRDVAEAYGCPVDFACPERFHPLVSDHPYLNRVVDSDSVDRYDWRLCFDTATDCARTEVAQVKRGIDPPNRADIWGASCGVKITDYSGHLNFTEAEQADARRLLQGVGVVYCPVSSHWLKDLCSRQREDIFAALDSHGLNPKILHDAPTGLPQFPSTDFRQWMSLIANAPLVVTVDTASVHMAGLANVPQVALYWKHVGASVLKHYPRRHIVQVKHAADITTDMVLRGVEEMM